MLAQLFDCPIKWFYRSVGSRKHHAAFHGVVELEQTGWLDGAEWDKACEHVFAGNAYRLARLRRRFVNGPIDWAERMGAKTKRSCQGRAVGNCLVTEEGLLGICLTP